MAADELAAELSLLIRFGSLAAALDLISVVEPASPADRKRPYVHHSRLGSSWPKAAGPLWSNPAGKAASITPRDHVRPDPSGRFPRQLNCYRSNTTPGTHVGCRWSVGHR